MSTPFSKYWKTPFRHECGMIWDANGDRILDVRGWGHLTGSGAHGLTCDVAAKVQDEMAKFVAKVVTENWPKE
jgi:hypothetical protein